MKHTTAPGARSHYDSPSALRRNENVVDEDENAETSTAGKVTVVNLLTDDQTNCAT